MSGKVLLAATMLTAFAVSADAQAKPDFSGQWTTAPEAVAAPGGAPGGNAQGAGPARGGGGAPGRGRAGDMGSGWGPTIRISQTAQQLTVEYAFYTRGDMQPPMKFVYALDGTESKNTVLAGHGMQEQRSTTTWDGENLVITTVHSFVDPSTGKPAPSTIVQSLSLASPTSLVVTTTRKGVLGSPDTTAKTTYRKL
jgi:hypothetical protein